jgi:hypothetical protein
MKNLNLRQGHLTNMHSHWLKFTLQSFVFIRSTDGTFYVNEDIVRLCNFEVARPDEVLFIYIKA